MAPLTKLLLSEGLETAKVTVAFLVSMVVALYLLEIRTNICMSLVPSAGKGRLIVRDSAACERKITSVFLSL